VPPVTYTRLPVASIATACALSYLPVSYRAFQTRRWLRYSLAVLGSMALQGPVIDWVADHRKHHTFADEDGDPHSPHAGHGAGLRGMVAGLWHAHMAWLFETHG